MPRVSGSYLVFPRHLGRKAGRTQYSRQQALFQTSQTLSRHRMLHSVPRRGHDDLVSKAFAKQIQTHSFRNDSTYCMSLLATKLTAVISVRRSLLGSNLVPSNNIMILIVINTFFFLLQII